jgi:hypothetical protein
MMTLHPGHVVVIVLGLKADECMKFLVSGTLTLEKFIESVNTHFQYPFQFHIIFDGISYPTNNLIKSIHQRITRDDFILYGRVVKIDYKSGQLSPKESTSSILA